MMPFLDVSLLPTLQRTNLLIGLEAVPGTSRPEMNRITTQASNELRAIPGVSKVGSHVGRAITGDAVVGINSGELWVSIADGADYDATVAAVQNVVDGYPGLARTVQNYQPERIAEVLAGTEGDIVVRVYGHELDVLREKALEVEAVLAGIDGVGEAQTVLYAEEPQVEIEVDLAKAEEHGIKPGDVRRQATTLLSGILVGNLFEEQKVFDVVVWAKPELRQNLTDINELMIDTPGGEQIALSEVADVRIAPAPTVIERDAVSRYVDVTANVNGRAIDAVKGDIESSLQSISIPFEYHMEVLSDSQAVQSNQIRLTAVTLTALFGIYLLLQATFSSWRLAFFILLTLPMALVGGVIAVFISGGTLSLGSLFGFYALFAVATRNGLVLIRHLQNLAQAEGNQVTPELVLRGAKERMTPVLMTALATGVAITPLIFGGNVPGNEIVRPMGMVILGGLITSTLLTLFIVPALYLRWPSTIPILTQTQVDVQTTPEAA